MGNMIELIKQASVNAINAGNPLDIEFGTIIDESLTIRIDQKRILSKEFFIIPESLTRYELDLTHSHLKTSSALGKIVIREGLKKGDIVALLMIEKGDRFLILDKVGIYE
ncbi:DUF2577 domain-containing protein [Clostridium weizhouense]|uniref:DUF2577 domain-containing protein n=1 Tax=Clostridium weizhouense TaxID=2859781 RepID=A0ABS7AK44_9CLOT|nr:DUF2577 domain-containing protein [Clostridium weizhouense]MBW6408478.1 DUF2577 domain-containing protein [Clostridium weizhouense]